MDLTLWFGMSWTNERVSWNPDEFGGVSVLYIYEGADMWIPDIGKAAFLQF